jgi:AAA15 family ATPase/GTPase
MINNLTIRNFKSIKDLTLNCKRINLFIGEPNTGKSNILEAMGLLSWLDYAEVPAQQKYSLDSPQLIVPPQQYHIRLFDFIRFIGIQDLFLDGLIDDKIEISIKKKSEIGIEMKLKSGFVILEKKSVKTGKKSNKKQEIIRLDFKGDVTEISSTIKDFSSIKFYRFQKQQFYFPFNTSSYLLPPHGSNLFSLVMSNKRLREIMTGFYRESDLTLVLKPQNMTFEIQSQRENFVFSYPYISVSDTLQRIIFHIIAMESNENSTLVFEEPESYAFPYFTSYLGERIAKYDTNQHFISTHNPYLLQSILEKADKKEVNVFVTFLEDFQTKVVQLTSEQISTEILDADPFFNLDKFTDRGDE